MLHYDVISFDLDGVLLNSEDYSCNGWIQEMFAKILADTDHDLSEDLANRLTIDYLQEHLSEVSDTLGFNDPEAFWNKREKYLVQEKRKALQEGTIYPYSDINLLSEIASFRTLTLVSNSPQTIVDYFLDQHHLTSLFEVTIGRSSTIEGLWQAKPEPDLLSKMNQDTDSDKIMYIGDRNTDKTAAEKAGIDFLLLNREEKPPSITPQVHDLSELIQFLDLDRNQTTTTSA